MRYIPLILIFLATFLVAGESYQAYHYHDIHHVKTRIKEHVSRQKAEINATLHVRLLEHNQTHVAIFWLQENSTASAPIQKESIHAPFVVTYDPDGFIIKTFDTLSQDRLVQEKLKGVIDALQFYRSRTGVYALPNALGHLEVNASRNGRHYALHCLQQYTQKSKRDDVRYFDSRIDIVTDRSSHMWQTVDANETIKFFIQAMQGTLLDRRILHMRPSRSSLPKKHWFFGLSADISQWHLGSTQSPAMTLDKAQKSFPHKITELKSLIERKESIENWTRDNLELLSHLSELLQGYDLDDQVSKKLFAELGYIDTTQSVAILSDVVLEASIKPRERFRSLMGLKNTSAPIGDTRLQRLLTAGLSSKNGEIEQTLGLLTGALAYRRVDRVPAEFQTISDALLNALWEHDEKSLVLGAIGNMHQSASNDIVQAVGDLIVRTNKSKNRRDGAAALLRCRSSTLSMTSIEQIIEKETNFDTAAMLIRATAVAEDRASKREEQFDFLITIAQKQTRMKSNRIAALETLMQSGYGKTHAQKQTIRRMMLHEKDSDVQAILRTLFRR